MSSGPRALFLLPALLVLLAGAGQARAAAWGFPFAPRPADESPAGAPGALPPTGGEAPAASAPPAATQPVAPPAEGPLPPALPSTEVAVRADTFPSSPTDRADVVVEAPSTMRPPAPTRPRFLATVAMGASVDASWSASTKTFVSPVFAGTIGFGDGPLGFQMRLVSSQATGRGAESGPDRLALDLMLALRPWARRAPEPRWGRRVLRAITFDLGLVTERISAGIASALREGVVAGGHVDLPLTAAASDGELRLRLAVRRTLVGDQALGNATAGASTEAFLGLVAAF